MKKYIAILRGINVGGRRKILMADLREQLGRMGLLKVSTYIQSGNIIFEGANSIDTTRLEEAIEEMIGKEFGYEVPVIIRSKEDYNEIIKNNPYESESDIKSLFLTFLRDYPTIENISIVNNFDFNPDKFKIVGKNVYGFFDDKYSKTKMSNKFFEQKLKVSATTRNWKTIVKLGELIND